MKEHLWRADLTTECFGGTVFRWHDVPGAADKATACRHIGDIPKQGFGNMEKPVEPSRPVED